MPTVIETHATAPVFPPGRYGRRRAEKPSRPWVPILLSVLVAAALTAFAARLYMSYNTDRYEPRLLAYSNVTDASVTVRFEVRKSDNDGPATCRVRALSSNGEEVGLAEVDVPPGKIVQVMYMLATSRRAFHVVVPACGPAER